MEGKVKDPDALRRCIKNKKRYATRVARGENTPQHIIACQGAAVKGNIPPGGIWEQEKIGWGNERK